MSTNEEKLAIERDAALLEIEQLKKQLHKAESSFSLNFTLIDNFGCQVQATMREGVTAEIIKQVFAARQNFVASALEAGYRVPGRSSVGTTEPAPAPMMTTSGIPTPTIPAPAPQMNGGSGGESLCQMIEIATAYKSGKTQIKFHCNGMEHPLTFTREIGDMSKLLAPIGFQAAHIVVGQKYPASCVVKWTQGEKYKNVESVRPA